VRTADNLASTAFGNILDLLCEGEIEGFPSARDYTRGTDNYNKALLKDVYLTDTPILRSGADVTNLTEADYNFKGVTVEARYGTNAQTYISKFGETTEDIKSVNVEILQATPVTRQITDYQR
jgi:predicted phage tail protein